MFGFKSIVALLAAAAQVTVSALPSPAAGGALVARAAEPLPVALPALDVTVRAPEAVPETLADLIRRGAPTTIPNCVTKATGTITPLLAQIGIWIGYTLHRSMLTIRRRCCH